MEQQPPHSSTMNTQRRDARIGKVTLDGSQHRLCRRCGLRVAAIGMPIAVALGVQLFPGRFWRREDLLYPLYLFPTWSTPMFHGDPGLFHLRVHFLELLIDV